MANQSQCLDGAPFWSLHGWEPIPLLAYNKAQRLALEALIAKGRPAFQAFLRREKMSSFLSDSEIQAILRAAVQPLGINESVSATDQALNTSLDCSSLTYFPVQSDVEPPVLELGWPAFVTGSFRGLTHVETYFQPCFGEVIYACKEAVRKQIRSAGEVSEGIETGGLIEQEVGLDDLQGPFQLCYCYLQCDLQNDGITTKKITGIRQA